MKKFYMIALSRYGCGLISLMTSVYNHIRYAELNGHIPIIDFKHYNNLYFKDNRQYKDNSWEYFFEQPSLKKLEDITEESSVIISPNEHITDKEISIIDSGTQTQSLSYQQIKKFFFQYTDGDNCKRIISLIEH